MLLVRNGNKGTLSISLQTTNVQSPNSTLYIPCNLNESLPFLGPRQDGQSRRTHPANEDNKKPKFHTCTKDEGTKVGILQSLKKWPWPPAQWWLGPGHSATLAHQSKFFPNLNKKAPMLVLEDFIRLLFFAMALHSDFIIRPQVQHTDYATGLLLISLRAQLVGQSLPASETSQGFKFTLHVHACTQYFQVLCSLR